MVRAKNSLLVSTIEPHLCLSTRFRMVPTFGKGTIQKFSNNVSEMKGLAARDFEDILQVSISSRPQFCRFCWPSSSALYPSSMDSYQNHSTTWYSHCYIKWQSGMPLQSSGHIWSWRWIILRCKQKSWDNECERSVMPQRTHSTQWSCPARPQLEDVGSSQPKTIPVLSYEVLKRRH